jgi:hypothetical protein
MSHLIKYKLAMTCQLLILVRITIAMSSSIYFPLMKIQSLTSYITLEFIGILLKSRIGSQFMEKQSKIKWFISYIKRNVITAQ